MIAKTKSDKMQEKRSTRKKEPLDVNLTVRFNFGDEPEDALKIVSEGINTMRSPERATLLVTHYQRLLDYVKPDFVHVLAGGRIIKSGGPELARELEEKGYGWLDAA
jgi:Fe-S cluster assembly ATPase SufC